MSECCLAEETWQSQQDGIRINKLEGTFYRRIFSAAPLQGQTWRTARQTTEPKMENKLKLVLLDWRGKRHRFCLVSLPEDFYSVVQQRPYELFILFRSVFFTAQWSIMSIDNDSFFLLLLLFFISVLCVVKIERIYFTNGTFCIFLVWVFKLVKYKMPDNFLNFVVITRST